MEPMSGVRFPFSAGQPSCNLSEALIAVPFLDTAAHGEHRGASRRCIFLARSYRCGVRDRNFAYPNEVVFLWLRYVGRLTSPVPAGAGRTPPSAAGRTSS